MNHITKNYGLLKSRGPFGRIFISLWDWVTRSYFQITLKVPFYQKNWHHKFYRGLHISDIPSFSFWRVESVTPYRPPIYTRRPDRYPFFRAGGDLRLHDNENMRPIDYTRRLEANSKFKKEMLQFLEQQQESFSNFQRTRQKIELGTPHRVKLTKPAKTSGMFGKNYGTFHFDYPFILTSFRFLFGTTTGQAAGIWCSDWSRGW